MTLSRRTVLGMGASLFGSFAGCSSVGTRTTDPDAQRSPPIRRIETKNAFEETKEMTLVVERDEEIVHWGVYEVPPANPKPEENYLGRVMAIEKPWMGCGTYEVSVRVERTTLWETIDFRNLEPSPSIDGKFQPVILRVEFSKTEITMDTVRLDDPLVRCGEKTTTEKTEDR